MPQEIYTYSYDVKNMVFTVGNKEYAFPNGSVARFSIKHDYRNRRLPIIRMILEMDRYMIQRIYENKDTGKVTFDLYEYQYNSDHAVINTQLYWQHSFRYIPARDQTEYITATDATSEVNIDDMRDPQPMDLFLIDMDAVKWFTQKLSETFRDTSKAAIIQSLLQLRNIPSGITIATPPKDNKVMDQVIVPMGDLIDNIGTINRGYGLWSSYPYIYYDLLNLYIIDRIKPNLVLPKAKDYGNVVLLLANPTKTEYQVNGSFDDVTSRTHYINLTVEPTITDYTTEIGSTKFGTVVSVNGEGNVNKTTAVQNSTASNYVYAYSDQTETQVINEAMYGPTVHVYAQNCRISTIKPYKIFSFQVDTQYYNLNIGKDDTYRLLGWSVVMEREGRGENSRYTHKIEMDLQNPNYREKT